MKTLIVKMLCVAVLMVGGSSAAYASDTATVANSPDTSICHKHKSGSDSVTAKADKHAGKRVGHAAGHHHRKKHHKKTA